MKRKYGIPWPPKRDSIGDDQYKRRMYPSAQRREVARPTSSQLAYNDYEWYFQMRKDAQKGVYG